MAEVKPRGALTRPVAGATEERRPRPASSLASRRGKATPVATGNEGAPMPEVMVVATATPVAPVPVEPSQPAAEVERKPRWSKAASVPVQPTQPAVEVERKPRRGKVAPEPTQPNSDQAPQPAVEVERKPRRGKSASVAPVQPPQPAAEVERKPRLRALLVPVPAAGPDAQRPVDGPGDGGGGNRAVMFPATMMRYMTFELSQALSLLSQQQVEGIFRIVESGHLVDDPPAPYELIRGARPICAETTWKRVGKQNKEGAWVERPGWSHQPEFLAALKMAKRVARQQWTDRKVNGVQRAVGMLQAGSMYASQRLLALATGYEFTLNGEIEVDSGGEPVRLKVEHKDMIAAGKTVLGIALQQAERERDEAADERGDAQAWWEATQEEGGGG